MKCEDGGEGGGGVGLLLKGQASRYSCKALDSIGRNSNHLLARVVMADCKCSANLPQQLIAAKVVLYRKGVALQNVVQQSEPDL